jgi:hypothetical protein
MTLSMRYHVIIKWKGRSDTTLKPDLRWGDVLEYMVDIYNSAMQESIDSLEIMPSERYATLGALMDSIDPDVSAR